MSDSYDQGRYGQAPGANGNWNDYMRGQADRERWNASTTHGGTGGQSPGRAVDYSGGGGGGVLILILLAMPIVVPSLIIALFAAPFLMGLTAAGGNRATFGESYSAASWGFGIFLVLNFVVTTGLVYILQLGVSPPFMVDGLRSVDAAYATAVGRSLFGFATSGQGFGLASAMLGAAILLGIPIIGVALTLRRKIGAPFNGGFGLVYACVAGVIAIAAGTVLTFITAVLIVLLLSGELPQLLSELRA